MWGLTQALQNILSISRTNIRGRLDHDTPDRLQFGTETQILVSERAKGQTAEDG